ncbi:MAG: murein biosynthesis integral membrane protein MurJ [Cardiobacteriaceae bacterium]|nr:murein biosynthesis integral membrane protein MurJ [Cardiobacteriaceae bacterium]
MSASLGRSSAVFAVMTLLSRILGLLRDVLVARYFDAAITDAFFAAFRIPNTLRRFFAEGGFANAFVPVFSATHAEHPEQLKDLLRHTSGTLLGILLVITSLGVVFSSIIITLVASGLSERPEQFILASDMLRIMFPYILLISLTAMAGGVLNTFGQFGIPALTPVLLNITLIVACLWRQHEGIPSEGFYGIELAWAVLVGGIAQLLLQLPFLWKYGLLLWPRWGWKHKGVRRILQLMLPTLFGSSIGQLTVLINTFLASLLTMGSISWLYYSDRLVELPVGLIGVALGTVILPKLSALRATDDQHHFIATLDWALRWGVLIGSAASVGLLVLAPSILTGLLYGGAFNEHDVAMTILSLRAYGIGAFFLIMVKVLAPAFYARHDTKTPVKAGISAMVLNMFFAFSLSQFFAHTGLAAASSLAAFVNMSLLLYFLRREGVVFKMTSSWFFFRVILANVALASILFYLQGDISIWLEKTVWLRLRDLLLLVIVGLMVYVSVLFALGLRWQHLRLAK